MLLSRKTRFIVKAVVVVAIFIFIFLKIDFPRLLDTFKKIDMFLYLPALFILSLTKVLVSWQMKIILRGVNVFRGVKELLMINFAAGFYSFVGDIFGGFIRFKRISGFDKRRGEALFSIVIHRYQSLLAIYCSFLTGFIVSGRFVLGTPEYITVSAFAAGCAFVLIFILVTLYSPLICRLGEKITVFFGRFKQGYFLSHAVADLIRVTRVFHLRPYLFAGSFVLALLNQIIGLFCAGLVVLAVGAEIPFFAVMWIFSLTVLANLLPISFYGLGIREGMLIWLLSRYGVSPEESVLIGLLMFFTMIVHGVIGGLLELRFCPVQPGTHSQDKGESHVGL